MVMLTSAKDVYISIGAAEDLQEPVELGLDGLTRGGVPCVGCNRVW